VAVLSVIVSVTPAWNSRASTPKASPITDQNCLPKAGGALTAIPWPQTRLDFERAWSVTQGAGVRVAVIDSGLDRTQPQLALLHLADGYDVLPGFAKNDTRDCDGHGTAVAGIIAAPPVNGVPFVGVAPGVTIVPIKQTNSSGDNLASDRGIAAGIVYALQVKARVINISVTVNKPSAPIEAAVALAAKAKVVMVAAAGNDGNGVNATAYPAAYSRTYPNVIAVSAANSADQVPSFSERGNYVTLCAPGVAVVVPARQSGYTTMDGTSFAAPYVTGTVALMLAARPSMTAAEVRTRLEATADPPPATVPDPRYGYGMVNPYRAVTSVREDTAPPAPVSARALPARAVVAPPSRRLQRIALAAAAALLILAGFLAVASMLGRHRRAALMDSAAPTTVDASDLPLPLL
jgi:membrane-anchored mycosin MYCP